MTRDFTLFIARLADDGALEAYTLVQGTGDDLEPIDKLFGAAWYLDTTFFSGLYFAGNGAEGLFRVDFPIENLTDDTCWNDDADYSNHVACDAGVATVDLVSTSTTTPDNDGLNCPFSGADPTMYPTRGATVPAPTASVEPLDCTSVGYYPLQLLKATNDHYYSLMRLTESGVYVTVFNLTYTEVTEINAAAVYEASDGTRYPYAAFDSKLCRFDAYRLDCYEGTMGVEESNAAAIIGNFYYYSNALGSVEGDGLWYASDLDTSPVFHDLTLPVNIDLFSSTIVDFAPVTEDDGTDEYVVDGIEGASYVRARRVFDLESLPSPVTGAPRRSSA